MLTINPGTRISAADALDEPFLQMMDEPSEGVK
jgi:hypothetical protein